MTAYAYNRMHPVLQFLILICMTVFLILIGSVVGMLIVSTKYDFSLADLRSLNPHSPNAATGLWILQICSGTLPLLISPILFAWLIMREPQEYLKTRFNISLLVMLLAFTVMIVSTAFIEGLTVFNQKLSLPENLKWLEEVIRQMEKQAEATMKILLKMDTIGQLAFNLLVIGLITGIAEEFLFRGCMQTILMQWFKKPHAAIWVTAFIFSFFHFEFFGFLPRMALGVLFGYFAWWSGSIWPAVLGHFFNNGFAVLLTYLYQHHQIKGNPDENLTINPAVYIISLILTVVLLLLYKRIALTEKHEQHY
jgi:hypothetical protein